MGVFRSLSVSVIRSTDGLVCESLLKSGLSFRAMIATTVSKTKVLLRVLLNRSSGNYINEWKAVSLDLKVTDNGLKQTSSLSQFVNRLLNGHKILINRLVWIRSVPKVDTKALIGSTGLSLGLVGVCVKRNGPTLISETDVMETECQKIRNIFCSYRELEFQSKLLDRKELSLKDIEFGSYIAKGCNGVVYSAKLKNISDEWFAIKMLFNFEAESNVSDVWKAMNRECVPFAGDFALLDPPLNRRTKLVPHPNVVDILAVFVDRTPQLEDSLHLYPDALPIRFGGYARNMSLFIVEKRYDMSLKKYLSTRTVPTNTSLVMLTQLLEAISFLAKCQITHRDIKTDNILVTLNQSSDSSESPWLVLTDFGFCLTTLSLPFSCDEITRGGNRALMAPEIIGAIPGPFARLDYTGSDLWAVGTIAYELFNGLNPFYPYPERQQCLQSISYKGSELPEPPEAMPPLIRALVLSFLNRNPNKRTPVITGVNVCQIVYHMSRCQLIKLLDMSSGAQRTKCLFNWLKMLSNSTLSKRKTPLGSETLSNIEFKLRVLFLSQVKVKHLNSALDFITYAFD